MRRLRVDRVKCARVVGKRASALIPQYDERARLSDLECTSRTIVSRNGMNSVGSRDLTAATVTWSPVAASAREAPIATAPYFQSASREDLAEYVCAVPFAIDPKRPDAPDASCWLEPTEPFSQRGHIAVPASAELKVWLGQAESISDEPRNRPTCVNETSSSTQSLPAVTIAFRRCPPMFESRHRGLVQGEVK